MKTVFKLLLISAIIYSAKAEFPVIFNNDYPTADTIYIDIVKVGDSTDTFFTLRNHPSLNKQVLRIGNKLPSFYFGESISHPNEWEEFAKSDNLGNEFLGDEQLLKDSSFIFRVRYYGDDRLSKYPTGKKEMQMILGLFDPNQSPPLTDKDLIAVDTFIIMSKKTFNHIESFEDLFNYDSVYIRPYPPPQREWTLKNIAFESCSATNQTFLDYSSSKEFAIISPALPVEFTRNSPQSINRDWKISYIPKDRGLDSAYLELDYTPFPSLFPEGEKKPHLLMRGFGVEQKLNLISAKEYPVIRESKPDELGIADSIITFTVKAGRIRSGSTKAFELIFRNDGNIPFGASELNLLNSFDNTPSEALKIDKELNSLNSHLLPGKTDTLKLSFSPFAIGDSVYIIELISDIDSRRIYGAHPYAKKLQFRLEASGSMPVFEIDSDSIDLGNIVIDCPPIREYIQPINNSGNEELRLTAQIMQPSAFNVAPAELTIAPFSSSSLTYTYSLSEFGDFIQSVSILTNENPPVNSKVIYLKGKGVPLKSSKIIIPDLKIKPGNRLDIPLLVPDQAASYASIFTDTLSYDPSLLSFESAVTTGTASEGCELSELTEFIEFQPGKLHIRLNTPANNLYFKQIDTLIKLRFASYLGNTVRSAVTMLAPRFSDNICPSVLSINPTSDIYNGSVTLDSLCGLELLAYKKGNGQFNLAIPKPNPASDFISLEFSVAFKCHTNISIFDSYGNKSIEILNELMEEGIYELTQPIQELNPGLYYIRMDAGIYSFVIQLAVVR